MAFKRSWLALLAGTVAWVLAIALLVGWIVLAVDEGEWYNAIQPAIYLLVVAAGGLVGIPWAIRRGHDRP